jgi:hypothetical protein
LKCALGDWDLWCVLEGVERMEIEMVFRGIGILVCVRRCGENENYNGLRGIGICGAC